MNFNKHYKMPNNGQRGFTLVELLLVLVILALIARRPHHKSAVYRCR